MKNLLVFAVLLLALSCNKQASNQLATEQETKAGKGKGHQQEVAQSPAFFITHNPDGTFTIDYNGLTGQVWLFFRAGDSLSTVSGNVIPVVGMSFYRNPVTVIQPTITGTYYQAVLYTGNYLDANTWVESWSNVVQ